MKKKFIALIAVLSIFPALFSCNLGKEKIYKDSKIAMDTIVTINIVSNSKKNARLAASKAFGEIERLSSLINFYSDGSELSKINRNAGKKPVHVSPETMDLIKDSIVVAKKSGGAFDPTIGAISVLWDFQKKLIPGKRDISKRLKLVSYKNIIINEKKQTVYLRKKGMMIDLVGIAKGYAADRAIDILSASGRKAGMVSVAVDIRAYGLKPDGKPWMVGIRDPRPVSATENILAALPLKNMAISTSGDYQRFFIKDGVRYHHLLIPWTGMPAGGCQSVSVIADKAVITDSFATAVFILGPEKGMRLLEKMGYGGVIVDYYGRVHITEGIKDKIEIKRPERKNHSG